ncbi:hypothetical protein Fmac_002465 [Flemingia macrophylla]|uniref:Vacuolar amino acid transporter YPQ1 n=1 Tax=Flemingia macrophylla TaxID=520843 RepID=A0ABD1NK02_9FABA
MPSSYCVKESKPCLGWVQKYFDDCLCNLNDEISFGFGFISLICWGVAEIPQILTNFRAKSSHGVSLAFLLTWVAGDIFNLVGCILEPATLPTQYYTALLYTITTIVLVLQSFYYDYIYKWGKHHRKINNDEVDEEEKKPLRPKPGLESGIPIQNDGPRATPRREYYYRSARSLASNDTPPFGTYLRAARSVPSTAELSDDSSSEDEAPPRSSVTQPRPIPRSVPASYGTFLAASMNLPRQGNALRLFSGRKLLMQEHMVHSALGQWLGWLMAVIYMGGRLPQIWLNIKRRSVEGLNPLMFIFALIANATYVGSILVRTTEWESIRANMPWLLDAIGCVALDLFIILQYTNYRYLLKKEGNADADYGDYKEASKTYVS